MANSAIYKREYNEHKRNVKRLNDDADELEKIANVIARNLNDEIDDVNSEVNKLREEVSNGVRHNSKYDEAAYNAVNVKECTPYIDWNLSTAINNLNEEKNDLKDKAFRESQERDKCKREYDNEKKREREEFLSNLGF